MSRLIETIRLLDGQFYNLTYHQSRVTRVFRELFDSPDGLNLSEVLKADIPNKGLFKCRLVYDKNIRNITFTPYEARVVTSLRMIDHDIIDYSYKFEDRTALDELFKQRNGCDDVLIIKNGMVTDATYSNIIFKKNAEWFTPASCLLQGTMRQNLIDNEKVRIEEISAKNIYDFEKYKLINSMLLDQGPERDVSDIIR